MQQRSCEEFAPDVQSKVMAVRMFLISASWMAVHGKIACISDRVIKPQNTEQSLTCFASQKGGKEPPVFSHNKEMRTIKSS